MAAEAAAHTADTSYARVRILEDRIELRLTYDIFTLQKFASGLDTDGDRALSKAELERATPSIQNFLREHVGLEVNGAAVSLGEGKPPFWPLDAPDPIPVAAWHTNEALISVPFDIPLKAPAKDVALLFDIFGTTGAQHSVLGVFEYRGSSTEVVFTFAEPDFLFDVAYAAGTPPPTTPPAQKADEPPAKPKEAPRSNVNDSPSWRYFRLGVEHILGGYDHLCFLLALLVVSRFRPLLAIVTSFTIAHSITLLLASFGVVTLPTRLIECAVALTIFYVAMENLFRDDYSSRWKLTFIFGLIHGFSFANTLKPQELPIESKAHSLLIFNLGVELGQLAVVAALLPLSILLAKWQYATRGRAAVSIIVGLLGLAWFFDRAFSLGWMPF